MASEPESHATEPVNIPVWCVGHKIADQNLQIDDAIVEAEGNAGYDMITGSITNSRFHKRVLRTLAQAASEKRLQVHLDPLTADDVNLHPGPHISGVIAVTSSWIEVESPDPLYAHVSKQVLDMELAYAAFCGLGHVVVGGPKTRQNIAEYAQAISAALSHSTYMQLLIQLPIDDWVGDREALTTNLLYDPLSAWDAWNTIRTICRYSAQLTIALEIPPTLPDPAVIQRWFAEPLRMLLIPSHTFCPNSKGFPVLSKFHQALLTKYMRLRPTPHILLTETDIQPVIRNPGHSSNVRHEPLAYLIYIRHQQKTQPAQSIVEKFGSGYQDYLQAPLQPLADNLESITYEVFEKDPVKYNQYEKAIKLALDDRKLGEEIVVAVVGAGRGPLVTRALRAAELSGRSIKMVAVEKNPNAYIHLLRQNRLIWNNRVTVIKSDMRAWKPDFQVDIMISELLGSFADNELSPECLDGVQRVLNPNGGVMIPQSYSAHLTPIMSPKIYADIASRKSDPDAFETPYVVMLQALDNLAENDHIEKVWGFHHPVPNNILGEAASMGGGFVGLSDGGNDHNLRNSKTTFKVPRRGVVHGLAGYFESVLYGDVELSTRPDTIDQKSKDMISWFPIFFPLKTPLYVPDKSEVDVSMWRQSSERKVWYEWIVEGFVRTGSRRFRLGSSDLHSSKKNGCLM
ncbi:PRMT5 arginine-N-methyltransferase-domain-containing protein [Sphaerosporella brunnea]|uniref:Protein arginine N-methyltransferase n=1 Tax=Sphaerosporella brunnea TaxID=1250544 RepID=A0A5J5ELL5_9PEZI|nr:PRMT5 arginine-N-methyltransferase-domain-containing protein [Sphaerosporella brunnea]